MRRLLSLLLLLPLTAFAQKKLNIYVWSGNVPSEVVRQFEKETGVKVNVTLYNNNEIMLAKLRTSKHPGYDIVMPSSYFVQRMRKYNLVEALDKTKLPNIKNIQKTFLHPAYDPDLSVSIPYIWGVTGIFYNDKYIKKSDVTSWKQLWNKTFYNQLLLLDDPREVFSIALLSLGYSANDSDPAHIKQAFEHLKQLATNIKVFSSDTVVTIMIDEDAHLGSAWNGDAYKAYTENKHVRFVFPRDGFVIWADTLAIPKSAEHKKEAYQFINFLLRADISKKIMEYTSYSTPNKAGIKLLPLEVQNDPVAFPSEKVLKRGEFQTDPGDEAIALYAQYWEQLKLSL